MQGSLPGASKMYRLPKNKGLVSRVTIRNELLERGLVVSYDQLTRQLELMCKENSLKNHGENGPENEFGIQESRTSSLEVYL